MAKLISNLAKGAWSAVTAYTVGDIAINDNSSYICIANSTNNEPPNATYWALLVDGSNIATNTANIATNTANIATNTANIAGNVQNDGWIDANETWTFNDAKSINVPAGALLKYAVGDRIKWTQATVKYGVLVTVVDTLLTIAVNTDYVVTDAAISANYYSHEANPIGYPTWFNYTPTVAWTNGPTTTTDVVKFKIEGRSVTILFHRRGTGNATASTLYTVTLPVNTTLTGSTRYPAGVAMLTDTVTFTIAGISYIVDNTQIIQVEFASNKPTIGTVWAVYPI